MLLIKGRRDLLQFIELKNKASFLYRKSMASSLKEKINSDLREAQKAKDEVRLSTLRLLVSSLHNREIEKRGKSGESIALTEEEVLEIVGREAKKRKEAAMLFKEGNRPELEAQELAELKYIEVYLPAQLSEEELGKIIGVAIEIVKPQSEKDFGRVMGEVMKHAKGRADSAFVSRLIKERLG